MLAYERLNMREAVFKKFEILYSINWNAKNQPAVTIWTDKSLAMEQEETSRKVVPRYS